ncbi:DUF2914 domain-containing protein [bacterium]|nr:DUF2914 domain-containing protein [bacterium]
MKKMMIMAALLLFAGQIANAQIKVDEIKLGTGVENKDIVGEATSFASTTEKVYCWMKLSGGSQGSSVTVKWYLNNSPAGEVPLEINGTPWRTYSFKTINGVKGDWKVEIVDATGNVLQTATFKTE